MFKALSLESVLARISNLTNIQTLLETFCIRNNVELTRDADLSLYERREGNDIDLFKLYLTEIDAICNDADCYFPRIDYSEWESHVLGNNFDNGINYKHVLYKRKK